MLQKQIRKAPEIKNLKKNLFLAKGGEHLIKTYKEKAPEAKIKEGKSCFPKRLFLIENGMVVAVVATGTQFICYYLPVALSAKGPQCRAATPEFYRK